LCAPRILPPAVGVDNEAANLVSVAVLSTFRVDGRVGSTNHFNQRPEPWWAVLVVTMKSVNDGTTLDIHRID
jgi:hypothetical protein